MQDDILIIGEHHLKAAQSICKLIMPAIGRSNNKFILTVAGESGAGKSEIAAAVANILEQEDFSAYLIQQDDYFEFPPKTNALMREQDILWVGPGEVRLDVLNSTILAILNKEYPVVKPLVIFSEDRITSEKVDLSPYRVIIIEGTYTTLLDHIDCRVFIDRDYRDTRNDRFKRNREKQDDYLEKILEIEHGIISHHKVKADILVSKEFIVTRINE